MPYTARDLIYESLKEMGAYAEGETPSFADASLCLDKLNRLFDSWAADEILAYNSDFVTYTLVPMLSPHTIGPGGTFNVPTRPIEIENASVVLNNVNPPVNSPLTMRDKDWWANQRVQTLQTTLPTDLYYAPAYPLGNLFFWPVPTIAYQVQLETLTILGQVVLATVLTLSPGYRDAIVYSLAESICPAFNKTLSPTLEGLARKARMKIVLPNTNSAPRIATIDTGMSSSSQQRATFNYRTGLSVGRR